jgi:hypothetical protein
MPHIASELPLWYRRRALADLDDLIAQAESDARQRLLALERMMASGSGAAHLQARLRFAKDRLALLRRSRECLSSGGSPSEADERP